MSNNVNDISAPTKDRLFHLRRTFLAEAVLGIKQDMVYHDQARDLVLFLGSSFFSEIESKTMRCTQKFCVLFLNLSIYT